MTLQSGSTGRQRNPEKSESVGRVLANAQWAECHRTFMDSIQPILAAKMRFYSLRLPTITVFADRVETEYNFSALEKEYLALLDMQIEAIKRAIYGTELP